MEFIIKFRDSNEPLKRNNTSGKRHRKIPEIICDVCGVGIPGTNALRKNPRQKFHKECRPYVKHGNIISYPKEFNKRIPNKSHGEKFFDAFDSAFGLGELCPQTKKDT